MAEKDRQVRAFLEAYEKHIISKGDIFSVYQKVIFKLIDLIDTKEVSDVLTEEMLSLEDIVKLAFFKEVILEMDNEFKETCPKNTNSN